MMSLFTIFWLLLQLHHFCYLKPFVSQMLFRYTCVWPALLRKCQTKILKVRRTGCTIIACRFLALLLNANRFHGDATYVLFLSSHCSWCSHGTPQDRCLSNSSTFNIRSELGRKMEMFSRDEANKNKQKYDWICELKIFNESKKGIKGLVNAS